MSLLLWAIGSIYLKQYKAHNPIPEASMEKARSTLLIPGKNLNP